MVPAVIEAAERGDLAGLEGAGLSGAWAQVADSLRALAYRKVVARPKASELCALEGFEGPGALRALKLLGFRALLAIDRSALEEVQRALSAYGEEAAPARLYLSGWLAFLAGDGAMAREHGERLEALCRDKGDAVGVVEGALLGAAGLLASGETTSALKQVRRAARMAQSERLWMSNFLAGVLLARARRQNGQAYLAARVASTCLAATGGEWRPWLDWELFFAGGTPELSERDLPVVHARREVAARLNGSSSPRGTGHEAPKVHVASVPHQEDVAAALLANGASTDEIFVEVRGGSDSTKQVTQSFAEMQKWVTGVVHDVPAIVCGIAVLAAQRGFAARVVIRAEGPAVRTLGALPPGVALLPPSGVEATRVEVLVAVLAFADKPLSRRLLFEATYGFRYRPELHEDAFKVLRSQTKSYLAGWATFDSSDGYSLHVHGDFAVLDPRCKEPTGNTILARLGQVGQSNAKHLARTLGIPLRTVQGALKQLVEDGACEVHRKGRQVEYVVEDTTFQEITLT